MRCSSIMSSEWLRPPVLTWSTSMPAASRSAFVDRLHGHGKIVHANDAADAAELRRALESGADRVSTDHVGLATEVIRAADL